MAKKRSVEEVFLPPEVRAGLGKLSGQLISLLDATKGFDELEEFRRAVADVLKYLDYIEKQRQAGKLGEKDIEGLSKALMALSKLKQDQFQLNIAPPPKPAPRQALPGMSNNAIQNKADEKRAQQEQLVQRKQAFMKNGPRMLEAVQNTLKTLPESVPPAQQRQTLWQRFVQACRSAARAVGGFVRGLFSRQREQNVGLDISVPQSEQRISAQKGGINQFAGQAAAAAREGVVRRQLNVAPQRPVPPPKPLSYNREGKRIQARQANFTPPVFLTPKKRVEIIYEYLKSHPALLKEEGVFRLSGNKSTIRLLSDQLVKGGTISGTPDVHDLVGLLKETLKDMKLPSQARLNGLNKSNAQTDGEKAMLMCVELMTEVMKNEGSTQMGPENMAIILNPILNPTLQTSIARVQQGKQRDAQFSAKTFLERQIPKQAQYIPAPALPPRQGKPLRGGTHEPKGREALPPTPGGRPLPVVATRRPPEHQPGAGRGSESYKRQKPRGQ